MSDLSSFTNLTAPARAIKYDGDAGQASPTPLPRSWRSSLEEATRQMDEKRRQVEMEDLLNAGWEVATMSMAIDEEADLRGLVILKNPRAS
jgi:hypothetical protein